MPLAVKRGFDQTLGDVAVTLALNPQFCQERALEGRSFEVEQPGLEVSFARDATSAGISGGVACDLSIWRARAN
jgi:hypothetical protein